MGSIGLTCVFYYAPYVRPTLRALADLRSTLAASHCVLVANSEPAYEALLRWSTNTLDDCKIVRHDNTGQEFGAYQVGADHLNDLGAMQWMVVANDTFAVHDHFGSPYRRRLREELCVARTYPAIVGRCESLRRAYSIAGVRTHRWMRSDLFAVNHDAYVAAGRRLYRPEVDAFVKAVSEPDAFFSEEVSEVLRNHLQNWLFGTSQGAHWYDHRALTTESAASLAIKARSILQELYLSALLDEAGAEFCDLRHVRFGDRLLLRLEQQLHAFRATSRRQRKRA